ncbi:MAG TPA: carbon storage regulator [Pirellulales bacterium]|jgi:carbon storage regulator
MLVLSRKVGERIVVGDVIVITVVRLGQGSVRIGVEAPNEMAIMRQELVADAKDEVAPNAEPAESTPSANAITSAVPTEALSFII